MPGHPSSTCLSVRPSTFLFKSNRLPHFSSDLSDIWLDCAQQYCQKVVQVEFTFFLLYLFQWIFHHKIYEKCKLCRFLAIFSKLFECETTKRGLQALWMYFQACLKNCPCGSNLQAIVYPKRGHKWSTCRFSCISVKCCPCIHTKLDL